MRYAKILSIGRKSVDLKPPVNVHNYTDSLILECLEDWCGVARDDGLIRGSIVRNNIYKIFYLAWKDKNCADVQNEIMMINN